MGDKTQLLTLVLAARFRKPWTVMAGILCATLLNHGLASWAGGFLAAQVDPLILRWSLAILFFVFGLWILIPDKNEGLPEKHRYGAFVTTLVLFFLAEMGDKTEIATVALGARYSAPLAVTIGEKPASSTSTTIALLVAEHPLMLMMVAS